VGRYKIIGSLTDHQEGSSAGARVVDQGKGAAHKGITKGFDDVVIKHSKRQKRGASESQGGEKEQRITVEDPEKAPGDSEKGGISGPRPRLAKRGAGAGKQLKNQNYLDGDRQKGLKRGG